MAIAAQTPQRTFATVGIVATFLVTWVVEPLMLRARGDRSVNLGP